MNLSILKEKIKSLSDENIDKELADKKNIKTFKYDAVASIQLATEYVVITTKKDKKDKEDENSKQFMHIDIEDPSEIIKKYNLVLVD